MAPFEKGQKEGDGNAPNSVIKKKKNKNRGKPRAILKFIPVPVQKKTKHQEGKKKHKKGKVSKGATFSSIAESLEVISDYHTLNKKLAQNNSDASISEKQRQYNEMKIKEEQAAIGGLERYQQASMYGAKSSKFVCADWVEPLLKLHLFNDVCPSSEPSHRPRILDVGAIDNQYLKFDWFDTVAIDLNAQHPSVQKADFFEFAHEHLVASKYTSSAPFDAIVMSLVLNFQGDPRMRGDMLALAADTRLLRPNGLLFVALPSASLDNSRFCTEQHFVKVCNSLHLTELEVKRSAKLTLMTFRLDPVDGEKTPFFYNAGTKTFKYGEAQNRRVELRKGAERNNFCVLLKSRNK